MRLSVVFLAVLLLTTHTSADDSCSVSLMDKERGIDAVVESCSSIGSYSLGGLYNGQWDKLTFQYPMPWKGTYATFNVDGENYCTSDDARDCTLMDLFSVEKPAIHGRTVWASWTLPNVSVTQSFSIVENRTLIKYTVKNTDVVNHTVGVRFHMDTMLGINDGAPIYIPGDGLKTREVEYSGARLNFGYWKAYNLPEEPTIVATGTIDPKKGMTYPDRLVVADWKKSKDAAWDYDPEGRVITGDSAVLIYYSLGVIEPGAQKDVMMGYGSEAPVLTEEQGRVGVTEITLNTITGEYCPGDGVAAKVDVLSADEDRRGTVELTIEQDGITYYSKKDDATFQKGQVRTLEYAWTIPTNGSGAYTVKATLYNETGKAGSKEMPYAIKISQDKCISSVIKVGVGVLSGMAIITAVLAAGLVAAAAIYLWQNRGAVEFVKYVDGNNVSVRVTNNTMKRLKNVVIEDAIPSEVEIKVHTLNALRKQNALIWEMGTLRSKESATLEYWVRGGRAVNGSTLRWDGGERTLT